MAVNSAKSQPIIKLQRHLSGSRERARPFAESACRRAASAYNNLQAALKVKLKRKSGGGRGHGVLANFGLSPVFFPVRFGLSGGRRTDLAGVQFVSNATEGLRPSPSAELRPSSAVVSTNDRPRRAAVPNSGAAFVGERPRKPSSFLPDKAAGAVASQASGM